MYWLHIPLPGGRSTFEAWPALHHPNVEAKQQPGGWGSMFHGSIPEPLRAIIYEHAGAWPGTDIYVGCSGNFTIERVLHARFGAGRTVHGCDIQAYSCALGWWLAGQPLSFTLREDHEDALGWLSPYLDGATGTLATLMLLRARWPR